MHIQSPRIFILSGLCPRMSRGCVECVCVEREREREREPHGEKPQPLSERQGLCKVCGSKSTLGGRREKTWTLGLGPPEYFHAFPVTSSVTFGRNA